MLRIERRVTAGAAVVALAAGFGSAAIGTARANDPAATTTITVDPSHQVGTLPADFVGLSFEMRELGVGSFDARTGNLVALFRTLNRAGNVRISGNTLDRDTLWVPAGQSPPSPLPDWVQDVVTPADIGRLDRFLGATGWHTEVGINVGHYDAALAADQARAMTAILGRRLVGAECGNEPNAWAGKNLRPAGYGYPQYKPDWEACAATLGSHKLAGPDTSSPRSTGPWFTSFAQDEHDRLALLTAHNYSVSSSATVTDLLSPQTDVNEANAVSAQLAAAKAVGLPVRLDETNSAAGGGILGVSDTYAAALWAMDYSLLMAQDGFAGLDFHGGLGVCDAPLYNGKFQIYTPICAANDADAAAKVYTAAPEYYGLYLASRMGPGTFLPVAVSSDHNVTAYAVRGRDGRTRIAVIEKDDTAGAPVRVDLALGKGRGGGHAEVVHLTGTSLTGKDGIAVQGASVDRRGHLHPHAPDRIRTRDGTLSLDVAAGSAVLITLDRDCH
ncbi:MAG: glycosyl hydrolase family 79 C-terminal domain-containing protein [Mycobacteriales bacterium]